MIDILIVEDNKEIAILLKDFLEKESYIVSVAESGEKALSLYETYGARLILLDIMLPGIDGFNVCSKIREKSNTPIIILSAKTDKEDKINGIVLGADDYIEKPIDIDILLAKINGIFKRRYDIEKIVYEKTSNLFFFNRPSFVNDCRAGNFYMIKRGNYNKRNWNEYLRINHFREENIELLKSYELKRNKLTSF